MKDESHGSGGAQKPHQNKLDDFHGDEERDWDGVGKKDPASRQWTASVIAPEVR